MRTPVGGDTPGEDLDQQTRRNRMGSHGDSPPSKRQIPIIGRHSSRGRAPGLDIFVGALCPEAMLREASPGRVEARATLLAAKGNLPGRARLRFEAEPLQGARKFDEWRSYLGPPGRGWTVER
jgi:hypothetical protein